MRGMTNAMKMHKKRPVSEQRSVKESIVKATMDWFTSCGSDFGTADGQAGIAHLQNFSAQYRIWGSGPAIVLVPGLAGGLELLSPLARVLAKKYQVISFQLRGEDDCFALRRRFGIKELVEDLAEFLDWHCLEQPNLMGVSFGGVLGLELAARFPRRIRTLIVQGAGCRFERGLLQQVAGLVLSQYPLPNNNPFVNQFFNLLFGKKQAKGPLFQFVTRQCWQTDQGVMAHRFHLVENFDISNRLDRIVAPTLLLAGDRDLLVSQQSLQNLREGISISTQKTVRGSGHLAFITQPNDVAQAVTDFLTQSGV
jgi:pimeloyl-ACP methyl ester carboxylesterase